MPSLISEPKQAFRFYVVAINLMVASLGFLFYRGVTLDTDILALLPKTEKDPVVAQAMDAFTRQMSHRIVFLLGHEDGAVARSAGEQLEQQLKTSGFFSKVQGQLKDGIEKDFYDLYFPYRHQLLTDQAQQKLATQGAQYFIKDTLLALNSPMSGLYATMLEEDPLLRFPSFLKGMPQPPGALKVRHHWLSVQTQSVHYVMLTATSIDSAFNPKQQKTIVAFLDEAQAELRADMANLSINRTGVLDYAAAGSATAETEVSTIGVGSILGVILLFLLVFRGPRPLFLGLLPIATGLLCGTLACFVVFGRIHLLTLGFGASIIGICIDYCFHYYCERLGEDTPKPKAALQHILPAISLGAFTSILGYLGLFIAPFPGLRQMALFSAAGLLGAFATVVLAFPRLASKKMANAKRASGLAKRLLGVLQNPAKPVLLFLCLMGLPLVFWGLHKLEANDDIRALQAPDANLKIQEEHIRERVGGIDASRFLLIQGVDDEALLQNEEAVLPKLKAMIADEGLQYAQSLSTMLPSQQRQKQNHALIAKAIGGHVQEYVDALGLDPQAEDTIKAAINGEPTSYLVLQDWLKHPAASALSDLYLGRTEKGVASIVVLGGLTDYEAIKALADAHAQVTYIDKVAAISDLLRNYRNLSGWLALLSYALVAVVILIRYGFAQGTRVMLPAVLAAVVTLAIFGLIGMPISLFNILALLLVLGIGIDYTIFFAESKEQPTSTMLAIMLSATTTLLSFGLLALSSVAFLQSFGLTVLFGIGTAFFTAPMALGGSR